MIRINLLPYKESTLVQWGQRQVLIYLATVVVTIVVMAIVSRPSVDYNEERAKVEKGRKSVEASIAKEQGQSPCDRDRLRGRIKREERKYRTVERLITERQNPKYVLRELSRILSEAWGPTLKTDFAGKDKRSLYNQSWSPSGVWITQFVETSPPDAMARAVRIEGGALAADDVAELLRRLQASAFFYDADLERFSKVSEGGSAAAAKSHLKFSIVAGVSY